MHGPANGRGEEKALCTRCEKGHLEPHATKTVLWQGASLIVIQNVPAMICTSCGEEYVDDRTALGLDRMRGDGLANGRIADRMLVPVLDYTEPEGWQSV